MNKDLKLHESARMFCSSLIADYSYYVDNREFDLAVQLFTEDGCIDRPDLISMGREEIIKHWSDRPLSKVTCHICSIPSFREITESTAKSVTYFTLYYLDHVGDGPPPLVDPVAIGEFHDEFTLDECGWRIKLRKVKAVLKRP